MPEPEPISSEQIESFFAELTAFLEQQAPAEKVSASEPQPLPVPQAEENTEFRPTPMSRLIGLPIMCFAGVRIVEHMAAGIEPLDSDPVHVIMLGVGLLIFRLNEIRKGE